MKSMDLFVNNYIAHRGVHNDKIKENSKEAIKKAIQLKIPVEFDITLTKDNIIVLCHDSYIEKNNKKYEIKDYDLKQLQNICHSIVTLEEILKLVSGKIPLLIELKKYTKGNKLEKHTVKLLDKYKGSFAIQSFSPKIIYWFKKNRNGYLRGQLLVKKHKSKLVRYLFFNGIMFLNNFTKPDFISYNIKYLPNKKIAKFKTKKPVLGWTVKNKRQIIKNNKYCNNFICDNIESIMEEL